MAARPRRGVAAAAPAARHGPPVDLPRRRRHPATPGPRGGCRRRAIRAALARPAGAAAAESPSSLAPGGRPMSLAILRVGTAVPDTVFDQREALAIARALACPTAEQDTWLPGMYSGTLIEQRHIVLPQQLVRDILDDTRLSGSVYLPKD